jgi:hypothetical protein
MLTIAQITRLQGIYGKNILLAIIKNLGDHVLEIGDLEFKLLQYSQPEVQYLLFELAIADNPKIKIANAITFNEIFHKFYEWDAFANLAKSLSNHIEQITFNPTATMHDYEFEKLCTHIANDYLYINNYFVKINILTKFLNKYYHGSLINIVDSKIKAYIEQKSSEMIAGWYYMLFALLPNVKDLAKYIIELEYYIIKDKVKIAQINITGCYLELQMITSEQKDTLLNRLFYDDNVVPSFNDLRFHSIYLNFQHLILLYEKMPVAELDSSVGYIIDSTLNKEEKLQLFSIINKRCPEFEQDLSFFNLNPQEILELFENINTRSGIKWKAYFINERALDVIMRIFQSYRFVPSKKQVRALISFILSGANSQSFEFNDDILNYLNLEYQDISDILLSSELAGLYPIGILPNFADASGFSDVWHARNKKIAFINKCFDESELINIALSRYYTMCLLDLSKTNVVIDDTIFVCIIDKYVRDPQLLVMAPGFIKFFCKMFEFSVFEEILEQSEYVVQKSRYEQMLQQTQYFDDSYVVNAALFKKNLQYFKEIIIECFGADDSVVKIFCSMVDIEKITSIDVSCVKRILNLIQWFVFVVLSLAYECVCSEVIEQYKVVHELILLELANFHDSQMRIDLTLAYFNLCTAKDLLKCFYEGATEYSSKSILSIMLITKMFANKSKKIDINVPKLFGQFVSDDLQKRYNQQVKEKIFPKIVSACKHGKSHKIMLQALLELDRFGGVTYEECLQIMTMILTPLPIVSKKASCFQEAKMIIEQSLCQNPYICIAVIYNADTNDNARLDIAVSYIVQNRRFTKLSICWANNNEKLIFKKFIDYAHLNDNARDKKIASVFRANILMPQLKRQDNLWMMLYGLCRFDKIHELQKNLGAMAIDEVIAKIYLSILNISETQQTLDFLATNILNKHDSSAILVYNATLFKYSKSADDGVNYLNAMQQFIEKILSPDASEFYNYRYDVTLNKHLQAIENSGYDLRSWTNNYQVDLHQYQQELRLDASNLKPIDYFKCFADKIVFRQHLPNTEPFNKLYEFFTSNDMQQQIIEQEINEALMTFHDLSAEYDNYMLMATIIKLCNDKTSDYVQQKKNVFEAFQFVNNQYGLYYDLQYLLEMLRVRIGDYSEITYKVTDLKIEFTDDYWKLLMMGNDVNGSCLVLYSDNGHVSRCLLTYVMSGHVKLIAIVTPEDKIIMRSVMRLCFDKYNNKPVIILENLYNVNGVPNYLGVISLSYAKYLCASKFKCDLVIASEHDFVEEPEPYPNEISVLDIPINTQEYVDALKGAQDAPYDIKNTLCVFSTKTVINNDAIEDGMEKTSSACRLVL